MSENSERRLILLARFLGVMPCAGQLARAVAIVGEDRDLRAVFASSEAFDVACGVLQAEEIPECRFGLVDLLGEIAAAAGGPDWSPAAGRWRCLDGPAA